jgi:hypothetical protein
MSAVVGLLLETPYERDSVPRRGRADGAGRHWWA